MTSQNDRVLTHDSSYSRNSLLNARKIKTFPETQKWEIPSPADIYIHI